MKKFFHYQIYCVLSFGFFVSLGQSINYLKYSLPEGLPSQEVYEVYQDKKGFIWFATDNGIARFDGKNFKTYHLKDGLSDPVVFNFIEDPEGRLWLKTYSGKIAYLKNEKIYKYENNKLLSNVIKDDVLHSVVSKKNQLWFSTGKLIGVISDGRLSIQERIPKGILVVRFIDNDILIGGHGISNRIKEIKIGDRLFPIQLSDTLNHSKVYCTVKWHNATYFSINNDIFRYNGSKVEKVYTGPAHIISLSIDHANQLWLGYHPGGTERFNSPDFKDPELLPLLADKSVSKVIQDNEEGYWISTLEDGVYHVPNLDIYMSPYPSDSRIRHAAVNSKHIFMSDSKNSLFVFDFKERALRKEIQFNHRIISLFTDSHDQLWLSTGYIHLYDHDFNSVAEIKSQSGIEYAEHSESIWAIGSTRLTQFNLKGDILKMKIDSSIYRTIHVDDSLIYLGIRSGIEIKNKDLTNITSFPKELSDIKISSFIPLNKNYLLIATIGSGFYLLDKRNFKIIHYNAQNKFIADNIYTAAKAGSQLWLGTENGIAIIETSSLLDGSLHYDFISRHSGLPNNKINELLPTPESMWVFTDDGYSIISLNEKKYASKKTVFYLKNVKIGTDSIFREKFAYDQNNLHIDFGFISFNTDNFFVRYRLSANDPWTPTQDHSLQFNSLGQGTYQVEIQYSVDNIYWREAYRSVSFSILAPWWKTWYFLISLTAFIFLIGFYLVKARISQLKQRNALLNLENEHQKKIIESEIQAIDRDRNRIAKDLHDGIGTTLTSIKMGINQVMTRYNQNEANEVENRLQDVLKEVKNIIHDLTPPALMQFGLHEGLKNYIEKISSDTHVQVKLDVFGEEIKQPKINLFVFRIIQELVINSLKHANAKNITIHLNAFDDLLNILYEDDGIGFVADEVTRGNGLYNIESRIQALQGKILFETSSKGVSYSIDIPLL